MTDLRTAYLADIVRIYRNYKALGDGALAQVRDEQALHRQIDPDSNSIAVTVKHLSGNLRSRFRDFLTSDGEKPDRDRDAEFEVAATVTRDEILGWWNEGWTIAMGSLEALTPDDLDRTVTIRGEALLVVETLNRLAAHAAYHVGQIVYLARHVAWPHWTTLSIAKGRSADFAKGEYTQGQVERLARQAMHKSSQ